MISKTKRIIVLCIALITSLSLCSCSKESDPLEVKVLLIPHFEIGEMSGDFPGEAQLFYEEYLDGCEIYGSNSSYPIFYNKENKVAMCLSKSGKLNAALCVASALSDSRFDYSNAYFFSFGCAGGNFENTVLGDLAIITSAIDYDLGHTINGSEFGEGDKDLWFHDDSFDGEDFKVLNDNLIDFIFEKIKDTELETTELSVNTLKESFGDKALSRSPMVIKGCSITSDNYWKGRIAHQKALDLAEYYNSPDPFVSTEMEDCAIAASLDKYSMLDRLITMRSIVNSDVFLGSDTPKILWGESYDFFDDVSKSNDETLDIFEPAMRNLFKCGKPIIEMILDGRLDAAL